MNCFADYIGIKWCNAPEPESGLYLNDLPGISLKSIDQLANEEQATFLGVWQAVQKRATHALLTALKAELSRLYKLNTQQRVYRLEPEVETTLNQTPAANEWRGVLLTIKEGNSSLLQLMLKQLSLHLKVSATTTIKLVDLTDSPKELGSYDLNGVSGANVVAPAIDLAGVRRLLLVYDATNIESVFTYIDSSTTKHLTIQGVNCDAGFTTLTTGNNTFGIGLQAALQCRHEALACANKRNLATALWYVLGAELMLERLQSDRLNRYTTIDAAKARELREEYKQAFQRELQQALPTMPLTLNDGCLGCNALLQSVTNLP